MAQIVVVGMVGIGECVAEIGEEGRRQQMAGAQLLMEVAIMANSVVVDVVAIGKGKGKGEPAGEEKGPPPTMVVGHLAEI